MKTKHLKLLFAAAGLAIVPTTLASLTGCNKSTSYSVTYDCDSYIAWNNKPTNITAGNNFTATYSLSSNSVSLNTSRCYIYVGGVDIKNKTGVSYANGTITIPADLITGAVTIYLRTQEAVTYNITFNANGGYFGTTSTTTKTVSITTEYLYNSSCPTPTKTDTDSVFNGWYTDQQCTSKVTFPCLGSSVTTLYAGWTDTSRYKQFDPKNTECFSASGVTCTEETNYYFCSVGSTTNEDPTVTLAGKLTKPIVFECNVKSDLVINLNGLKICSGDNGDKNYAPLTIMKGEAKYNSVTINANDDTANVFIDNRTTLGDYDACINSQAPITNITGTGGIKISTSLSEGIRAKADGVLNIKQSTLYVDAYDTAIRGQAGITITDSAKVTAYSKTGDGLKTKDTSYESKSSSNRYGSIEINGSSNVTISSGSDAIDAAYDAIIDGDNTIVDIATGKYSQSSGSYMSVDDDDFFIRMDASYKTHESFISNYYFEVVFSDQSTEGSKNEETDQATLKKITKGSPQSGGTVTYNYYKASRPLDSSYEYAFIHINNLTDGTTVAKSDAITISNPGSIATNNGYTISSYTIGTETSPGTITLATTGTGTRKSYETYNYKSAIGSESSNSVTQRGKTTYGAKGIKCGNSINIKGGSTTLYTSDDAIHAGYGTRFAPGSSTSTQPATIGSGNVNISGGNLVVTYASDDAIHADNTLTISGGNNIVLNSYEAIEAGIINISGGSNWIFAEDDAVNAAECGPIVTNNVNLNVTGGYSFVTAYGGDVDAIDSNNTMTMSGGVLVAMGGSSNSSSSSTKPGGGGGPQGGTSTAIDVENSISQTDGVLVAIGKVENEDTKFSTHCTKNQIASSISQAEYTLSGSWGSFTFETQFAYSSTVYAWADTKPTLTKVS